MPRDDASRDVQVFELACEFLLGLPEVTQAMVEAHCDNPDRRGDRDTLGGVYCSMISSAQNRQAMPHSISGRIGGIEALGVVLCDFEPSMVVAEYGNDSARLLSEVKREFPQVRKMRHEPRSHWPVFCRAALSCSRFLSRFGDASDFHSWVGFFDRDDRARPALPLLIAEEVFGFRFALACDFLKELGYMNFNKPDVHIKRIFSALAMAEDASDLGLFRAVARVAARVGKTPYYVDKLFWLIGSGRFYRQDLRVGRHGDEFIKMATSRLA